MQVTQKPISTSRSITISDTGTISNKEQPTIPHTSTEDNYRESGSTKIVINFQHVNYVDNDTNLQKILRKYKKLSK